MFSLLTPFQVMWAVIHIRIELTISSINTEQRNILTKDPKLEIKIKKKKNETLKRRGVERINPVEIN